MSIKYLALCILFFILAFLWLLNSVDWDISKASTKFDTMKGNIISSSLMSFITLIFSAVFIRIWYDRHHNYSNIENFKKNISIPDELK